jgi:hypothetical protein
MLLLLLSSPSTGIGPIAAVFDECEHGYMNLQECVNGDVTIQDNINGTISIVTEVNGYL